MNFSVKNRSEIIDKLKNTKLDVLAIGGGITGAGVAIQASGDGLKTGLIEMQDFAGGTSSRSTKLVHGGIRYLKTFDVGVVSDTVKERAVVQGIAPHIPRPAKMILPIYDEPGSTFDMFSVKIAMKLYDKLANVTGKYASKVISRDEALKLEPSLNPDKLMGAGIYLDFRNNDSRLVIENIKQAYTNGALPVSRVKALDITHDANGKANGVLAQDLVTGDKFNIKSKIVIDTAGPWSDRVRKLDKDDTSKGQIRPTKGVHLVISDAKLKLPATTYFDTGDQDGRMVFVIPSAGKVYFGTTDTDYKGDYKNPTVTKQDVDYLLNVINHRYPNAHITLDDIEASWAGLRPLLSSNGGSDYNGGNKFRISNTDFKKLVDVVKAYEAGKKSKQDVEAVLQGIQKVNSELKPSASSVSRGSSLKEDKDGLLILAGGKITDYRKMAAGAMDKIKEILEHDFGMKVELKDSKKMQVSGGHFDPTKVDETIDKYAQYGIKRGIDKDTAYRMANRYGSNSPAIFDNKDNLKAAPGLNLGETLSLHYALDHEMTMSAVDFLLRRTNRILFAAETLPKTKQPVVDEMARYLNWNDAEKARQLQELNATIAQSQLDYLK